MVGGTGSRAVRRPLPEGRVRGLAVFRVFAAAASLAAYYLLEVGFIRPPEAVERPALVLHAGYFLYALLAWLLLPSGADRRRLALAQLAIDVIVITALAYVTGPLKVHAYVYFLPVLAGGLVLGLRAGVGLAAFSSCLLGLVVGLYYAAIALHLLDLQVPAAARVSFDPRPEFLVPFLFFFFLSLHVVAWLSGRLGEELSRVRILNEEILHNMSGGVVAVDRFGAIAFANAQGSALLGLKDPPARLQGRDYARTLPADVALLFRQVLSGGDPLEKEIRLGETPVEVAIAPLGDGRVEGLRGAVAIFNDLTLRSQVEQMEQRAERFQALLEMSAGIAHEIRNPLASIRGAVQELDSSSFAGEDDRKLLQIVLRESDRLNRIVSDFLEYATERPVELALVNVADVLREAADTLGARTPPTRTKIRLEVPRQIIGRGAGDKLQQVFLNLGLNALEACGDGGHLVIRCLSASEPGGGLRDGVLVEFEDDGPGIAKEDLPKLFTPFFTTKPRGTGMGLAIARKIVQAHKGTISIDSTPGKGTVARVWIPAS